MNLKPLLKYALGREKCDTLFTNATFANLCTMELETADIAVKDGVIIGIGEGYEAGEIIDCTGTLLVPGFIEGHTHIESTYMTPRNAAAAMVAYGTTTAMPDPHEIANTCGVEGVRFMKRESENLPVDFYYGAPSCVPASPFETPFQEIRADEIKKLFEDGTCSHLGEMMNFPGVCFGDDDTWDKLNVSRDKVITGHSPRVVGKELCAYLLGGVTSDHERETKEEAFEAIRRGMFLMIRQCATGRNLKTLAPLLIEHPWIAARCITVSDDLFPEFMRERGELDGCLRELIEVGVSPFTALRTITLSPAEYFRLYDRGIIAPCKIADIVMLDNFRNCKVLKVWKRGKLVAENGAAVEKITRSIFSELPGFMGKDVKTPTSEELRIVAPDKSAKINVIGMTNGQIITKTLCVEPNIKEGLVCADVRRDIAKMVVVEKNRGTGKFSVGFIKGFGLKRGAFALSVAHDAHNFTCVGIDDESMAAALAELARMHGGIVVADGEKILASLELPVGGLMSLLPIDELCKKFSELRAAYGSLGCENGFAFMQLSFMSLSVIPELKLTDKGYVDISDGGIKPLFVAR
ncbi:MAG: adenine deaminase [Synergistes sp.]|nr:adenine deaminase [Synergistes sp.]